LVSHHGLRAAAPLKRKLFMCTKMQEGGDEKPQKGVDQESAASKNAAVALPKNDKGACPVRKNLEKKTNELGAGGKEGKAKELAKRH